MVGLSVGLSLDFGAGGIDDFSESRDFERNGQSFCDVLASGLVGIAPLLVSAGPAFFLGLTSSGLSTTTDVQYFAVQVSARDYCYSP